MASVKFALVNIAWLKPAPVKLAPTQLEFFRLREYWNGHEVFDNFLIHLAIEMSSFLLFSQMKVQNNKSIFAEKLDISKLYL